MNLTIDGYNISIIPEQDLSKVMDQQALPYLSGICKTGFVERPSYGNTAGENPKGLYYEAYLPENARGAVVISHGFCESIEKYKEMIYYFTQAGLQVYLADHRGHGRSLRDVSHFSKVHIRRFEDYVEDLHAFITQVVKPSCGDLPLYLYAHSMGGGIGALYLETYPDTFRKAVLNAPMLAIALGSVPELPAYFFGWLMVHIGKSENFAPGHHAFIPGERFEDSGSACPERFWYYQNKKEATPLFQNCGASCGWAYEAMKACRRITKKENCNKVKLPVLVFQAQDDNSVKPSGMQKFVENTPSAKLVHIADSKHEIYNSCSRVLKEYYKILLDFLTK